MLSSKAVCGSQRPVFGCTPRAHVAVPRSQVCCQSHTEPVAAAPELSRRDALLSLAAATVGLAGSGIAPLDASAKDTAQVGTYLPEAGVEDFRLFVPDRNKTPAIRAGTVDRDNPYRLALPPTWREQQVANIQSGNYCQPRCAEPWTEVIFTDANEGKVQVIVSPLVRLTNLAQPKLEDVGTPEGLLGSLGSYITGTYLDEEDVVAVEKRDYDGRTYYYYEANAAYGSLGPHTLTTVTTKGDLLLMCAVSATDKQWARPGVQGKLRKLVETFRA